MFWKWLSRRILLLWLFLTAVLGLAFYLILVRGANSTITQQLLRRQQTLVRAEASNIKSFFQVFGDSIAVLAQLKTITSPSSSIWSLDAFTDQWRDSGIISGVALTDSRGIVKFNSNVEGTHTSGISLADRDYFLWAKNSHKGGEYFIGQPVISRLGPSKDQLIVPVASPVYRDDSFVGVVVAAVKMRSLTQHYLELMMVSDSTDVFLVDRGGGILYSNVSSSGLGSNISEVFKISQNILSSTKEGKVKEENQLVAYAPILLSDQKWFLIMASPIQDVKSLTTPIYIRIAGILLLVSFTILFFGTVVNRENLSQKRLVRDS